MSEMCNLLTVFKNKFRKIENLTKKCVNTEGAIYVYIYIYIYIYIYALESLDWEYQSDHLSSLQSSVSRSFWADYPKSL